MNIPDYQAELRKVLPEFQVVVYYSGGDVITNWKKLHWKAGLVSQNVLIAKMVFEAYKNPETIADIMACKIRTEYQNHIVEKGLIFAGLKKEN